MVSSLSTYIYPADIFSLGIGALCGRSDLQWNNDMKSDSWLLELFVRRNPTNLVQVTWEHLRHYPEC